MKLRDDARILVAMLKTGPIALVAIADPESRGGETIYGPPDWRDEDGPSFGWDTDSTLRRVNHHGRCNGPAIHYSGGGAENLAAWPVTSGLFVT